jgi:predicted ATP-grasp superfamily ATP-dependent carboligase
MRKTAESTDAAYVIAPETNRTLQSLVEIVEQTHATSLNCRSNAIGKVADKAVLYESLRKLGLSTPKTIALSILGGIAEIKRAINGNLSFPVIIKPSDGVSCAGLSVAQGPSQVAGAVDKIKREQPSKDFLAQEYVNGVPASVSLISSGDTAVSISLNKQDVTVGEPSAVSSYNGGLVPFDSPLKPEAFGAAEKIFEHFRDLRGYVGVDLVLTEKEPVVIEVNPRLTTSYVGLRRVVDFNPAQAIVNAILNHEIPTNTRTCGYTNFSKIKTCNPTTETLQKTYRVEEVISPPFPVSADGTAFALISSYSAALKTTSAKFREAKKRFQRIMSKE